MQTQPAIPAKVMDTPEQTMRLAVQDYIVRNRNGPTYYPAGQWVSKPGRQPDLLDSSSHWTPSPREVKPCCPGWRTNTWGQLANPKYLIHVRTYVHVANVYGVTPSALQKAVREYLAVEKVKRALLAT